MIYKTNKSILIIWNGNNIFNIIQWNVTENFQKYYIFIIKILIKSSN